MRKLLSVLCVMMLAGSALAIDTAVTDMAVGPVANYEPPQIDAQWDMLFWSNIQATLANQLLLGGAFAGNYFWITGGGLSSATTTDNRIYRLTPTGAAVDSFLQPNVGSGWGFRDIAFDGTYLYGGCESTTITAWDLTGALAPAMNVTRPAGSALVRALAYDPITDSFWTGNFGSALFNFTRTGSIIWTGPATLTAVYGMAWDATGPWLWIYDQTGTPGTKFHQFNPTTHVYTGVTYTVPLFGGLTANIAGGAEWSDTYSAMVSTIVAVGQGTAFDNLYVLEMYPTGGFPNITVTMVPENPPIIIPPAGGSFNWTGTVTNGETTTQTFDFWIMVTLPNGNIYGPALGPVALTLNASAQISRVRTQAIPASAPSGNYTYTAKVGDYPSATYDSDSFPFTKSAVGDGGAWVGEWANTGESFEASVTAAPASFALQGNYPNPFNPTTTINFSLGNADNVTLSVYDLSGRLVSTLVDGYREAGSHAVSFDASGLASGVYMYRLTAGAQTVSAKMILSK